MTASSRQKRKILQDYKYLDPEGHVQIIYYKEARDAIKEYYANQHKLNWLYEQALLLKGMSAVYSGGRKTRYENNANAVISFAIHFAGSNKYTLLEDVTFLWDIGNVTIKVTPDLHVKKRNKEKFIRLEFQKKELSEEAIKIMCQTMFEVALANDFHVKSSDILLFDVWRGKIYKGARMGSRLKKEIEAACANIEAIWNTL